ncbi:MAG: hypothetical protein PVF93_06990 [Chromatiaceae bacterium]
MSIFRDFLLEGLAVDREFAGAPMIPCRQWSGEAGRASRVGPRTGVAAPLPTVYGFVTLQALSADPNHGVQ